MTLDSFHSHKITVSMSASDWSLNALKEGVEEVASRLSQAVEAAINESKTRLEAELKITHLFSLYHEFGARSRKPYSIAGNLLDQAFP